MGKDRGTNGGKYVHTSGTSPVDLALWDPKPGRVVGGDAYARMQQLNSTQDPLPSQKYSYQRGLAKAALELPEREQIPALVEVLAAMGLLERIMPRWKEGEGD